MKIVNKKINTGGAGDQGIMVGYACRENQDLMPQEYYLARSLYMYIYYRHPDDGKTQITLNNDLSLRTVVVSWRGLKKDYLENLVLEWMNNCNIFTNDVLCNPAGDWEQGGFDADWIRSS